jgi:hypothetical protein
MFFVLLIVVIVVFFYKKDSLPTNFEDSRIWFGFNKIQIPTYILDSIEIPAYYLI